MITLLCQLKANIYLSPHSNISVAIRIIYTIFIFTKDSGVVPITSKRSFKVLSSNVSCNWRAYFYILQCVKALVFYDQGVSTLNISAANDLGDTALHMASRWGFGEYNAIV